MFINENKNNEANFERNLTASQIESLPNTDPRHELEWLLKEDGLGKILIITKQPEGKLKIKAREIIKIRLNELPKFMSENGKLHPNILRTDKKFYIIEVDKKRGVPSIKNEN